MTEYETELREFSKFVPELANFEKYLCFKFEEGLFLKIREKISFALYEREGFLEDGVLEVVTNLDKKWCLY